MGLLLFFAAGYVMGSRAGSETLDDVIDAARAIRRSEEFHDLVQAVRVHAADSLRGLAAMVERGPDHVDTEVEADADAVGLAVVTDLVERVKLIVGRR